MTWEVCDEIRIERAANPAQRCERRGRSAQADAGTVQVINALFRELMAIFPAWKQAWPDQEAINAAKATWTKAFMAERSQRSNRFASASSSAGRLVLISRPAWESSSPCQPTPEMLGIPTLEIAFREACRNAHPSMAGQATGPDAVWHTAKEAGSRT
jgi:hypothetical protein